MVAITIRPKAVKEAELLYIAGSVTLLELAGLPWKAGVSTNYF